MMKDSFGIWMFLFFPFVILSNSEEPINRYAFPSARLANRYFAIAQHDKKNFRIVILSDSEEPTNRHAYPSAQFANRYFAIAQYDKKDFRIVMLSDSEEPINRYAFRQHSLQTDTSLSLSMTKKILELSF